MPFPRATNDLCQLLHTLMSTEHGINRTSLQQLRCDVKERKITLHAVGQLESIIGPFGVYQPYLLNLGHPVAWYGIFVRLVVEVTDS